MLADSGYADIPFAILCESRGVFMKQEPPQGIKFLTSCRLFQRKSKVPTTFCSAVFTKIHPFRNVVTSWLRPSARNLFIFTGLESDKGHGDTQGFKIKQ